MTCRTTHELPTHTGWGEQSRLGERTEAVDLDWASMGVERQAIVKRAGETAWKCCDAGCADETVGVDVLRRIDSGRARAWSDFMVWTLSQIEKEERKEERD